MTKDKIIDYFNSDEAVKRIKELENFIDNDKELNELISNLKKLQKKMINSKKYNLLNQYKIDLAEYNKLKEKIMEYPFVEEYLECLEIVNDKLKYISDGINEKINYLINR